jgi:glycosyltransferase involved in cell wall biosynthesis
MPVFESVLLGILTVSALVLLIYWAIGLTLILRTVRTLPTARDGLRLPEAGHPAQSVCVVVPAHNEADNIVTIIESLKRQDYPDARYVLVLDRCTDATPELARRTIGGDPRFEIVEVDHCPPDWTGKVHALTYAAGRVAAIREADVLLFSDADTRLEPSCLRATVALLQGRRLDLLSLHCTLTSRTWFERLIQPAASLELCRQYPLEQANREQDRRPFANGQFMMFRRAAYEQVGGHAGARDELLEDIALSRLIERQGLRAGLLLADGLVVCHMYRTWDDFRRGWKRIFTEAANRRSNRLLRTGWRTLVFGTIIPLGALACLAFAGGRLLLGGGAFDAAAFGAALLALAVYLAALCKVHALAHAPLWGALAHPLGSWAVGAMLVQAGRDLRAGRPTLWRGREYLRRDR